MLDLEYSLTKLAKRFNDGAKATRANRLYWLCASARALVKELGFPGFKDTLHLKPRHIEALLKHWQGKGNKSNTIVHNLTHLRAWARWIGKPGLLPSSNKTFVSGMNASGMTSPRLGKSE